jgi:hypothetical protein
MGTLTLINSQTQVRPWTPAAGGAGAWNNVAGNAQKMALKTTNYGVTLPAGYAISALAALDQWMSAAAGGFGASSATQLAQKRMHALGLEVSENAQLSNAQAGNGASTNVVDRGGSLGPCLIVITTAVGSTPTCTYQLEGSNDNSSFTPLSSADSGTPTVFSAATFTIVTATTVTRIVNPTSSARYIRITYSANTNVTNTAVAQVNG